MKTRRKYFFTIHTNLKFKSPFKYEAPSTPRSQPHATHTHQEDAKHIIVEIIEKKPLIMFFMQ